MGNLLKSELYKMYKEPSLRLLFLTFLITASLLTVFLHVFSPEDRGVTGMTGLSNALQINIVLTKFSLAVLGGFFLSREHGLGTMKLSAASGHGRGRIYAAKLVAYLTGVVLLSLMFPLICTLGGTLLNGFGSFPDISGGVYALRSIGFTILYGAAFGTLVAVFAIGTRMSGITVGAVMLFLLFFDSVSQWLASQWALYKTLYEHSIFHYFMDIATNRVPASGMPELIIVPLLSIAVFGCLGVIVFRRMEIK
ncbi:ABC transporter permease [Paenibacillus sp. CAU 1782]